MNQNMAVITKRAYNAKCIRTVQFTNERYDNKDSGWRFFYGDEDDHVLERMECFRLISLEEILSLMPQLRNILDKEQCTYYHYQEEDGTFSESEHFAAEDAPETDPFLQAFIQKH